MYRLYIAVIILLAPVAGWPEVYKWTDEQGQVHYGDRPAGDEVTAERLSISAESQEGDAEQAISDEQQRMQQQQHLLDVLQQERSNRRQAQEQAENQQREAVDRCQQVRQDLVTQRSAAYLYRKNKNGEREILNDAEHAQAIAQTEAAVEKWCK